MELPQVTAAEKEGARGQVVDVNLNILEPGSFRMDREALKGITLYASHAHNILEGLRVTMTGMLQRVAEGKYGGEARSLVDAQYNGAFEYDSRVSSLLVATQNLLPPYYCQNANVTVLPSATQSNGTITAAMPVACAGGNLKHFMNYGLAATATVEAVLLAILKSKPEKEVAERARCYKEQIGLSSDTAVDNSEIVRNALGLSMSLSMLKGSKMALWRDLQLSKENLTALQLFFYRHCLRHCAPPSVANATATAELSARQKCHIALLNMEDFFKAYRCNRGVAMEPIRRCL